MLGLAGGPVFGSPQDDSVLARMLEGQDELGIQTQILSTGPNSPYLHDCDQAMAAAREINDTYAAIVARYGGRFAAFGSVPLPHGDAAAAEAIRCIDELGFAGLHLGCSALGHALDDPAFTAMWSELDRREAIVYVHPGGILCGSEPGLAGMNDPGIAVTIGSAAELATAALRLASLCRSHPRLRVIIGLLGGALPFLLQRVVWLGERFKGKSVIGPDEESEPLLIRLRRFHYDTNLLPDPAALTAARNIFGIDRLLFGSDAPALAPQVTVRFMQEGGLSEIEIDRVLRVNAACLFGDHFSGREYNAPPPSSRAILERSGNHSS